MKSADTPRVNADPHELARFSVLASQWWDPHGKFRPLHDINPLRLARIEATLKPLGGIAGKRALDVGCGGGLLAEGLARRGAEVTAIDLSPKALAVARLHALESGLTIDYREISAEALSELEPENFDLVACLEMLEHVPDPAQTVAACARLVRPGGYVFFSTISRTAKAYALAILGAEYLLGLLPRGTHEYAKFIRPSELAAFARAAGLELREIVGMRYNPFTFKASWSEDTSVNYWLACRRPES
ncbi:MAG: bifunctional 2-polyprenyl-6-hydroxyphenol methylase/3-demethylubiquinol 3-O-methyltransferase UbiG [Casimicrobiaceae bacterium]|nr:bifunctional 2-polyprenyl-6-hydroxyphenol methylase/3-demethylubiquinol 3-O-methyltransferase UbiG [Casimicrobiaceae bacterium]MCX8098369.1 bifunctional 2-polyprenyl-6-hydroxyphenol methylase/3-demethylubiquinol 3-O-methyltransferase UbiG [Casimicrobiaceae bacterium]MDW8312515.1 bifunctional 2-polyprenyl-6-hydroxyphenol methylase/3-demethylubiquinol 3-O-methyltransferase UbiG [Burkholderiales bacterium]